MGLEKQNPTEGESAPTDGEDSRLRLLVERAPVAMGIVSLKGVIEYANPTLESVFGKDLATAGDLIEFVQIGSPSKTEAKRALAFWQDEILGKRTDENEPEPFRGWVVNPLSPLSDPSNGTPKRPTPKANF